MRSKAEAQQGLGEESLKGLCPEEPIYYPLKNAQGHNPGSPFFQSCFSTFLLLQTFINSFRASVSHILFLLLKTRLLYNTVLLN